MKYFSITKTDPYLSYYLHNSQQWLLLYTRLVGWYALHQTVFIQKSSKLCFLLSLLSFPSVTKSEKGEREAQKVSKKQHEAFCIELMEKAHVNKPSLK